MKRGPTKFYSVYCTTMPFRFLARIACSRCIDAGCCCACFIRSAVCVSWSQWVSAMPSKTAHGRSRCRFRCRLVYRVSDRVRVGATWQIRSNSPSSAAMRGSPPSSLRHLGEYFSANFRTPGGGVAHLFASSSSSTSCAVDCYCN